MNLLPILAICIGGSIGSLLRWQLAVNFNPVFPFIPLGTLAANLVGGYLVGLAVAWLSQHSELPPEVRLFVITGFLGGLTTFSSYSAEVVGLLNAERYTWAFACAAVHLIGSFGLTAAGMATYRALARQ